jgi:hypothetical protein
MLIYNKHKLLAIYDKLSSCLLKFHHDYREVFNQYYA